MSRTATSLLCISLVSIGLLLASASQAQTQIPDGDLHATFSGLAFNRATNTFDSTATVTNVSSQLFSGVFSLELPNIVPGNVQLANPTCKVGGVPVLVFSLPSAGLAPGAAFNGILLKFSNPARGPFTFGHTLFAGDICADTAYFHAFSDAAPPPDPDLIAQLIPVLTTDCLTVLPQNPLTLGGAMTSLRARLNELAGAGAIEGFLNTNAGTSPATLGALAGGAMATNQGPGALAALLAAHQNDPSNPAHLVNAAGTSALLGMPNEALALLDAADAMGGDFTAPMGFDGHAIALNNRGFALLQLGQFEQAQAQFVTANALEPYLAEARMNLAVAQLCLGQDPTPELILAAHRSPAEQTIDQSFDLSQGVAPDVPKLNYPGSASRLRAFADNWFQIQTGVLAKTSTAQDNANQAHLQFIQEQAALPLLAGKRIAIIYGLAGSLEVPSVDDQSPPGLGDLLSTLDQNDAKTVALYTQITSDSDVWHSTLATIARACIDQNVDLPTCAPYLQQLELGRTQVRQYLSPFYAQEGAYELAFRGFVNPWYRAMTGLAANLSDAPAYQERSYRAQASELFLYSGLVNRGYEIMNSLALWWEDAQTPDDLSSPGTADIPNLQSANPCSGLLKAAKLQATIFDGVNVDINCEKVKVELSEPGLGPFAQLTYPRSGDWTVFFGVKGSLPGTTARVGVYIRGNDDSFTDAGLKTSQSFGVGPLKVESPANMELGIADAIKCPFGSCY